LWFQAGSIEIFGPTLFAARLPSTVFGLATALLVYHIGKDLYNWQVGLTAGLLFLTTPMISIHHHSATTADLDIYLVFFGTAFVWLVWQQCKSTGGMMMASCAGAAAVLVKSFAAGVFLFAVAPVVLISWRQYLSREPLLGVLGGLAVLVPWPLYAYLTYPDQFVEQLIGHQITRSQGGLSSTSTGLLPTSNFPYFKFVLGIRDGLWTGEFMTQFAEKPGQIVAHLSVPVLLTLAAAGLIIAYHQGVFFFDRDLVLYWWVLGVPLFFSLVGGNHDWYIQPMFAPLAVLGGMGVYRLKQALTRRWSSLTDVYYVGLLVAAYLTFYSLWSLLSSTAGTPATV
jgi:4-amino-4-deoxy-L-arabinose transferase-like glycosyltransferase